MFQKKAKSDVGVLLPVLQVSEEKRNKNFNLSTSLVAHDIILGRKPTDTEHVHN